MTLYDKISSEYKSHDESPQKRYSLTPTFLHLLGNIIGRDCIDFGCGSGYSSRILAKAGAKRVTGIDISKEQIKLARKIEIKNPLGIEYFVGDMKEVEPKQKYDIATAYLSLHYAETSEDLEASIKNIANSLNEDGTFVGIINNPLNPFGGSEKIGALAKPCQSLNPRDGDKIKIEIYDQNEKIVTSFNIHHYSQETYESLFRKYGFNEVEWLEPFVIKEGTTIIQQKYWDNPSTILFRCRKKPCN